MAWISVAKWKDVEVQGCVGVEAAGKRLAVYSVNGCPYATSDICTHQLAYMSEGAVDGEYIECPMHQGRFHIPTGKAQGAPVCKDLQTFETRLEGEEVLVNVSES
jgi:nitrite reductase/ring-hydroxylating ferredoxin subunit